MVVHSGLITYVRTYTRNYLVVTLSDNVDMTLSLVRVTANGELGL